VSVIELLSPINKVPNALGYDAFRKKREQLLRSGTHWIEIDLLRTGERLPEVAGESDYHALLKRVGEYRYAVWYFNLRDRMPTIAIALRPTDEDVPLDLQTVLRKCMHAVVMGRRLITTRRLSLRLGYARPMLPGLTSALLRGKLLSTDLR
jgi:hypothetical protein